WAGAWEGAGVARGRAEATGEPGTCLADRALDGAGIADADPGGDADPVLDLVLELLREPLASAGVGAEIGDAFDIDGQAVEMKLARYLENIVGCQATQVQQQLLDLTGKYVHTANDQHVIGTTCDLRHAAHGACGRRQQPRQVARPIADDRQRLLRERSEYQLAFHAVL